MSGDEASRFCSSVRGIGDEVGDVRSDEEVEDVRPAVHALRLERALLLGEVEEVDVAEGDVVEVEVAAEVELHLHELGQPAAEDAAAGHGRLGSQRSQRSERKGECGGS
jgi:hypothetical protein